ncbi:MAG TPA: amino acid adenylation domain-containing protein [Ktedonobacteraceae bacterium]|nr:amino acid adenylation domain-containing protein [Ktedonobacteraceae bacterium]
MRVAALLAYLREYDVQLWTEGDRLRFNAPKGVLTPALRAALAEKKAEIIEILSEANVGACSAPSSLISSAKERGELPLSSAQQGLWFLNQLAPSTSNYTIPGAICLDGRLDIVAMAQSLNEIVRRHEILRTTFTPVDGRPVQVVAPALDLPLPFIDLSRLSEAKRKAETLRLIAEQTQRPFDLARGPLLRASLLRLGSREHVLQIFTPHIIFDDWSMGIFVQELATLYEAFAASKPSSLPVPAHQYADYALWQQQWIAGEDYNAQLDYWQRQLDGMPQLLDLPTDRPRPPVRTFQDGYHTCTLSRALTERLKALSRQEGVTLFMTLLATFQVLLYRYTGQQDIAVGTPVANRMRTEFERVMGCFVNPLVLRTDLSGNPTFRELLGRVREVALGAYTHQELPFERLVEAMVPKRNLSYTPFIQVMFVLQNAPMPTFETMGLALRQWRLEDETDQLDLCISMTEDLRLSITEVEGKLTALLKYNQELFEAATISQMMGHLQTLLESVTAYPEQPISTLPLLSEAELEQVLGDEHTFPASLPVKACLHTLFEQQVERTPEAVALVYQDEYLTYGELNRRANHLAHHLHCMGVGPEVLVGLYLERSLELLIGLLAILKAGGAYVPLDPRYPQERLAFLLADTRMPVILSQQSLQAHLPAHSAHVLCIDSPQLMQSDSGPEPFHLQPGVPAQLAYVIYTSGSTGTPKGVLVSHDNVVRLFTVSQPQFGFTSHDVWTLFHSSAFDFSVWELWGALLYGGRLVVVPALVSRAAEAFYRLLVEQGVTVLNQTPSAFLALMQVDERRPQVEELALRLVIFGGEALELARLRPWVARHGDEHPRLVNMYGITETTVHVTSRALSSADIEGSTGSVIGQALPDLKVYIMDEWRQPVPPGVAGEIYVGGAGVARGYLRRPELTSERFVMHPFGRQAGERLYRTGDRARYRGKQEIEYLGRLDEQVKVRGYRIELGEIEALLSQHAEVRESVVIVQGEAGDKRLVAYVAGREASGPSISELRQYMRQKLPDYMQPSLYVVLEKLPLTANGKVDRRALPAPEDKNETEQAGDGTAPRGPVEEIITKVWRKVLVREHIGVHDNFFDIGGHSLLMARVHSELQTTLNKELSMTDLFTYPTISSLSRYINSEQSEKKATWQSQDRARMHRISAQRQRSIRQKH